MAACSSSELQLPGASGIVMANETEVPNQNIMLNLLNGGVTNNCSKSGSTPSHASLDSKTGINPSRSSFLHTYFTCIIITSLYRTSRIYFCMTMTCYMPISYYHLVMRKDVSVVSVSDR